MPIRRYLAATSGPGKRTHAKQHVKEVMKQIFHEKESAREFCDDMRRKIRTKREEIIQTEEINRRLLKELEDAMSEDKPAPLSAAALDGIDGRIDPKKAVDRRFQCTEERFLVLQRAAKALAEQSDVDKKRAEVAEGKISEISGAAPCDHDMPKLNEELEQLRRNLQIAEQSLRDADVRREMLETTEKDLRKAVLDQMKESMTAHAEMKVEQLKAASCRGKYRRKKAELQRVRRSIQELQVAESSNQDEKNDALRELQLAQSELAASKSDADRASDLLQAARVEAESTQKKNQNLRADVARLRKGEDEFLTQKQSLEKTSAELAEQLESAHSKITSLRRDEATRTARDSNKENELLQQLEALKQEFAAYRGKAAKLSALLLEIKKRMKDMKDTTSECDRRKGATEGGN